MTKPLDCDAIANILESSDEDEDFSGGSSDNYEPTDSEVSSAESSDKDTDTNMVQDAHHSDHLQEDIENNLQEILSAASFQHTSTIWSAPNVAFEPRKTVSSHRVPDIGQRFERSDNPYGIFMKIFPESLFMRITQCTNERIEIFRKSKREHKNIKLTDIGEIKIVIGCMIIMSYNRLPSFRHYWSKHHSMGNDAIKSAISRDRFQLLSSKMYFASPEKPDGASKLYYVEDMMECLKSRFLSSRMESAYQSIDESMTKFKGRSSMKQYLPLKPTKRGIKMWLRCDSLTGYTYDFNIYCGKEGVVEGTLGERVVNQLAATIRETDVTLCFDRFFTSINLLETLNYAALGTVMPNRKKLPVINVKLNKGQCVFRESSTGLMYAKWHDTKEVIVVSNCHSSGISTIEKKLKNGQKANVDCPEMIKFYRQIMGGVDRADQIAGQYELDRKSTKWWKKVFYRLLMMSIGNSWVISSQLGRRQNPLIDFMIVLAENMIEEGKKRAAVRRCGISGRKRKSVAGHLPVQIPNRRRCASCAEQKKERRTKTICEECQIPLCKDCFGPYHK